MAVNRDERTVGTLLSDLTHDLTQLFRNELHLAKAEMRGKIEQAGTGMKSMAVGGILAFAGALVLLQAVVIGVDAIIDRWWPQDWVAPLLVGLVVLLIGVSLLRRGQRNLEPRQLAPQRTTESLRRDGQLVREHVK
jgi:uncharacterized membrane protein YcjF (UPF0283 family)